MGLTISKGKDFEPCPQGSYPAILYQIIDLGTQRDEWKGKPKLVHKVRFSWELLGDEKMEDGRPFSIHRTYTAMFGDRSNLQLALEAIRGRKFTAEELEGFHLRKALGAPCLLQVVHQAAKDGSGKIYANAGSLMKLPKGMPAPEPVNPQMFFDLDAPDQVVFDALPEFVQQLIAQSPEYAEWKGHAAPPLGAPLSSPDERNDGGVGDMDDDIPY
jgi:hypothetical protein